MTSETQTRTRNEPAERLRARIGWRIDSEAQADLDAALREQTRITPIDVERLRDAMEWFDTEGWKEHPDDYGFAIEAAAVAARYAALPHDSTPGEAK